MELFNCNASLSSCKCSTHNCGLEKLKKEAMLRRCSCCNVETFSFGWRYFHELRCTLSLGSQKMLTQKVIRKNYIEPQKKIQCDQFIKKKLHKCCHCDYQTTRKWNLDIHNIKHTPAELRKWFKCDECEYKTIKKWNLNIHNTKHLPAELQKWFKCDQCEYQTKYTGALSKHKIIKHTSSKLQKWCDQCDHPAKPMTNLRSHKINMHTPIELQKWFKCELCKYKTKHLKTFKNHQIKFHASVYKNGSDVMCYLKQKK